MSPPKAKVIVGECISLSPTAEEAEIIWGAVREAGLEESGAGVLQLLMACLYGEEEHPSRNSVFQYFKEHPEDLQLIKSTVTQGIGALLQRVARK